MFESSGELFEASAEFCPQEKTSRLPDLPEKHNYNPPPTRVRSCARET